MLLRPATLNLCSAISQFRRVQRRFFRSADSLGRVFLPQHRQLADKAVRAPLVAAWPALKFSHRNRHFDGRMRIVADQFKILELEIVDVLHRRI